MSVRLTDYSVKRSWHTPATHANALSCRTDKPGEPDLSPRLPAHLTGLNRQTRTRMPAERHQRGSALRWSLTRALCFWNSADTSLVRKGQSATLKPVTTV